MPRRRLQAPTLVRKADMEAKILSLARAGKTLPTIAKELGMDPSQVHRYFRSGLRSIVEPEVEEHRKLRGAQLEELLQKMASLVLAGKPNVKAATEARNMIAELCKLFGLYPEEKKSEVAVGIKILQVDEARFLSPGNQGAENIAVMPLADEIGPVKGAITAVDLATGETSGLAAVADTSDCNLPADRPSADIVPMRQDGPADNEVVSR